MARKHADRASARDAAASGLKSKRSRDVLSTTSFERFQTASVDGADFRLTQIGIPYNLPSRQGR
jgi:hypothetical protein